MFLGKIWYYLECDIMKKRFKGKRKFRKLKVLSFILVGLVSFLVTINVLRKKVIQELDPRNYINSLLKTGFIWIYGLYGLYVQSTLYFIILPVLTILKSNAEE